MSARILVIDDADHIRTVMQLTLKFQGYEVTTANDGQEGLTAAAAAPFDLIFCDIEMPVMNGVEFVRRFRAEVSPATPIILLTAERGELIKQAMALGATATIDKPFEPIILLQKIERYLGPDGGGSSA
jgi:two-component system chemotaxis response regulator CheY